VQNNMLHEYNSFKEKRASVKELVFALTHLPEARDK
jgi:hypothetical protein